MLTITMVFNIKNSCR